jgi:hypothetical protein
MLSINQKLTVAVLLNDNLIPKWIYDSISNLVESGYADITLIISGPPEKVRSPGRKRIPALLLVKIIERIDFLLFRRKQSYSNIKDVTNLKVKAINGLRNTDRTGINGGNSVSDAILDLTPDLVVKFGKHHLISDVYSHIKYGIWTFSADNGHEHNEVDYGFWQVVSHQPTIYSAVAAAKSHELNETIFSSWESIYPYSITLSREKVLARATLCLARLVEGICVYGDSYLSRQKERFFENNHIQTESNADPYFPDVIRTVARSIVRLTEFGLYKLLHTDAFSWQLRTSIDGGINNGDKDFSSFNTIHPPRKGFWADPFVVANKNNYYVFVEEFVYATNKAHLSVLEIDSHGRFIKSEKIIEQPYHMSYPFVFTINGVYYMIPETCQNKTIELYRCIDFPYKWTFEKYIIENISATDTTLFNYDNKWWLFTTIDQTRGISGCSTELFLFYTDDPIRGTWTSHPLNPIISDESRARCAGKLYIENGKIFRPSQDCSLRYGRGLNINHVARLNEQEYDEVLIKEIKPDWDPKLKGLHTINSDKDMIIIDTYKFHRRISL